jgi:FtsZ-interacting cell division protein ZipA
MLDLIFAAEDSIPESLSLNVEILIVIVDGLLVLATIAAVFVTLWDSRKKLSDAREDAEKNEQYLIHVIDETLKREQEANHPDLIAADENEKPDEKENASA